MKVSVLIFLCLVFNSAFTQNCNCSEKLNYVVKVTEKVYSGFPDKVNSMTIKKYQQTTNSLKQLADNTQTNKGCYEVISKWLMFFNDKHISLNVKGVLEDVSFEKLTFDNLKQYTQTKSKELDKIEGFWTNGSNTMGIMKLSTNTYIARWFGGYDLKMKMVKKKNRYELTYLFPDSTLFNTTFKLNHESNLIRMTHPYERYWFKSDSALIYKKDTEKLKVKYGIGREPNFSKLENEINYIRIGSMAGEFALKIDSLIKQHSQLLSTTKNLIIDVRTNDGGNDDTYFPLIPLLYTQPFWMQGGTFYNEEHKKNWNEQYKNLDSIVFKITEYPKQLLDMFEVNNFPKKVVILMDDGTSSSGETFLQVARQSKKVILMGENSNGLLDYGNVRTFTYNCPPSPLTWEIPTFKIVHFDDKQVDNIGISPQIRIPKSEKDWIKFAINYFKKD